MTRSRSQSGSLFEVPLRIAGRNEADFLVAGGSAALLREFSNQNSGRIIEKKALQMCAKPN